MREAQEGLEVGADPSLEAAHRFVVADVEIVDRIGQHSEKTSSAARCRWAIRKTRKYWWRNCAEHAALGIGERGQGGIADDGQRSCRCR